MNQNNMTVRQAIEQIYMQMYGLMIAKNTRELKELLDDDFILIHMTGFRQSREGFLKYILSGTLNYFSCNDSDIEVTSKGDDILVTGKSVVEAAVFGGEIHTWRLCLRMKVVSSRGQFKIKEMIASTF